MDAVEEIKSRLAIEDVLGEYVQLKRSGRNWKGLSPFTNERTPSFMVSPEKQIWHDFSSGKGGDMFSFVMEMEGLDFKATLDLLARKAGVDLAQFRTGGRDNSRQKERLYELLEWATKFYQVQFSRSQTALEYVFNKRQFTKDTALAFQLGYAPNTGDALVRFLQTKKFTIEQTRAAGVSTSRYGRVQDMFRGRLMIPLADGQGRVIGFTARLLADDPNAPKYINTPQTILYDKSRHVYGLHLAKEAIRKSKYVVIAEGNLDVIMSHQAGVRQVVATAGTALTEQQLKALGRFTPDIRLSFDADRAGMNATERAIPIASKVGVSLSVIDIPSGKDPDELIKQNPETWQKVITEPKYALDWLIERYAKLLDLTTAQGKKQFSDVLLPIVRNLTDSVEQDHYLNKIAELAQVSREALTTKLRQNIPAQRSQLKHPKHSPEKLDQATIENTKTQNHLLAITLKNPELREYLALLAPEMLGEPARELFKFLQAHPNFSGNPDELKASLSKPVIPAQAGIQSKKETSPLTFTGSRINSEMTRAVQSLPEYAKILILQYEELYQGLEPLELRNEAARLQARVVENFVKHEKQKLASEFSGANDTATKQLLERARQFDELLKAVKGGGHG